MTKEQTFWIQWGYVQITDLGCRVAGNPTSMKALQSANTCRHDFLAFLYEKSKRKTGRMFNTWIMVSNFQKDENGKHHDPQRVNRALQRLRRDGHIKAFNSVPGEF